MTDLTLDRYAAEIVAQTEQLTSSIKGADLAAPVPTCAGWSLGDLLRHLGGAHRWAEEIVRTLFWLRPVLNEEAPAVPRARRGPQQMTMNNPKAESIPPFAAWTGRFARFAGKASSGARLATTMLPESA